MMTPINGGDENSSAAAKYRAAGSSSQGANAVAAGQWPAGAAQLQVRIHKKYRSGGSLSRGYRRSGCSSTAYRCRAACNACDSAGAPCQPVSRPNEVPAGEIISSVG